MENWIEAIKEVLNEMYLQGKLSVKEVQNLMKSLSPERKS